MMTLEQKVATVRAMTPVGTRNMEDDTVIAYLKSAELAVMNRLMPFVPLTDEGVPERYEFVQVRVCVYNINKRGAEGETKHIEVGTERDFPSADIPDDLLNELVPMCGVPL